jgi:DNA-binding LytR/AlgR family response regulator
MVSYGRRVLTESSPSTVSDGNDAIPAHASRQWSAVRRQAARLILRSSIDSEGGNEPSHESTETSDAAASPQVSVGTPTLLVGEREHRLYVLKLDKIDYIESEGNYVKFHVGNAEYISRDSVKRLSTALAGSGFVRIERSLLINVRAILFAQRLGRGSYAFTLGSGSCLRSGAKYREEILRVIPLAQVSGRRSSATP